MQRHTVERWPVNRQANEASKLLLCISLSTRKRSREYMGTNCQAKCSALKCQTRTSVMPLHRLWVYGKVWSKHCQSHAHSPTSLPVCWMSKWLKSQLKLIMCHAKRHTQQMLTISANH